MNIGFIGCGNMATAIVAGIINSNKASKEDIYVYDIYEPAIQQICDTYGVNSKSGATEVVEQCDIVILAVKPNVLSSVLNSINYTLEKSDTLLVSIAAGKAIDFIRRGLTHDNRIIRVMPNINAKVGEAISAYCFNDSVTDSDKKVAEELLSGIGEIISLDESYFPLFGVIGGCSPAFVYMFIDAMARAAVKNGIRKSDALKISAQSVLGSAKMILESDKHPWELIDNVCSPGGTTIEGVTSLQADGFETAIKNAIDAALDKDSRL